MPPDSPIQFIDRLPEAFREWLGGRRVEEVECVIADIAGVSRGKAMPFAKFVREDRMFLPTSIYPPDDRRRLCRHGHRQPVDRVRTWC